jgi:exodeoxyribonuclease VII small subunit
MTATMSDPDDLSFEQALHALQQAVERLEDGGLPLEAAVALYEQGMQLVARCTTHLDQAEVRVLQIEAALEETLAAAEIDADTDPF